VFGNRWRFLHKRRIGAIGRATDSWFGRVLGHLRVCGRSILHRVRVGFSVRRVGSYRVPSDAWDPVGSFAEHYGHFVRTFFLKPALELEPTLTQFETGLSVRFNTPDGEYVRATIKRVGIYCIAIGNMGRSTALEPVPRVCLDGSPYAVSSCWARPWSRGKEVTINSPSSTEDDIVESVGAFFREGGHMDKMSRGIVRQAVVFYTIEGFQSIYIPAELVVSASIPSTHLFEVLAVGEFELTGVLFSKRIHVEDWQTVTEVDGP
jgi:hypothetical protein